MLIYYIWKNIEKNITYRKNIIYYLFMLFIINFKIYYIWSLFDISSTNCVSGNVGDAENTMESGPQEQFSIH